MSTVKLLSDIVERAAARRPAAEAFRFKGRSLTYDDLLRRMNSVAFILRREGVQPGDRVGVCMEKRLECATAIYGILRAGGVYVPLDPNAPAGRLTEVVREAGIRHLVSEAPQLSLLTDLAAESDSTGLECVVGLRPDPEFPYRTVSWEACEQAPQIQESTGVGPDDPAYIIFTSGSTGKPKGIVHSHRSGLSYARLSAGLYGLREDDRISDFPPLHFDQTTFGYFSGPLAGATTVIIPDEHRLFPASLSKLIEEQRITVWYSVPLVLIQLLERGALEKRKLDSLRWILFGGEPFLSDHLRHWMNLLPHARFSNVYGPAEVNQCTYFHVPDDWPADGPVPLGDVWGETEKLVLDDHDRLVAAGESGELLIRSSTMMLGYWNRPDLNRTAFHHRPNHAGDVDVFYRTGDMVRESAEGVLEFLGRRDRQIKLRGYRVELDEIEAVLGSHDRVIQAGAFRAETASGEAQIEAAVVMSPGPEPEVDEILRFVGRRLPTYAVPTAITILDSLPMTASGKTDYPALQTLARDKRDLHEQTARSAS